MSIDHYDTHRFRWYEKPTLLGQKMFHLPILGWVTVFQFMLIVGIGMPAMFAAVNFGGYYAAPWPLLVSFLFAKFRPPLLGYEMRLYHIIRFRMAGRSEKKAGVKPRKYEMPRVRGGPAEAKPEPDEPIQITVHDRPWELRMSLPPGISLENRLEVRIDGTVAGTPHPDTDGTVHLVLYPDDMKGERTVTIHDNTGTQLAGRTLVFVQG